MAHYLLDTGVVVRHLRGYRPAVQALRGLGRMGRLAVASITRVELHAGMFEDERFVTQKLLSRFVCLDLDRETADLAGDLMRESRGRNDLLAVPDAIIAATAIRHQLRLVTFNIGDFTGITGLAIIDPLEGDAQAGRG
jgi:tRNA(fMet)-specific endonuclease VapC